MTKIVPAEALSCTIDMAWKRNVMVTPAQVRRLRLDCLSTFIRLAVLGIAVEALLSGQTETTLGFDGLADLSLNVDDFGVHFTGAQVLACGGSLNCGPFPPFSGSNVIYDAPSFG